MQRTKDFQLKPFAAGSLAEKLTITGYLRRQPGRIEVEYRLAGPLADILWPKKTTVPSRRHELWRTTCFELFFAVPGDPAYREVNLAPNGCWGIYHFTNYRTQMREEPGAVQPLCRVTGKGNLYILNCTIDCRGLVDDSADLELAVSSVIQTVDGDIGYWAIVHQGAEPDFHKRTNFSILLPGGDVPSPGPPGPRFPWQITLCSKENATKGAKNEKSSLARL